MRRALNNIALVLILLAGITSCATAQNYPQKTVDGKKYYVYQVAPGNTLFAIAKAFSVSVGDLVEANPGSEQGLDVGQEIIVPLDAIDKKVAKKTDIRTDGAFLLHTVQKKETLFSISKLYGVSLNDLSSLNPESVKSLSTGAVLRIPIVNSTKVDEAFIEPARSDTFMVHQVESGETPYSISRMYEVSLDSLNAANNEFEGGIRVGQWIRIPKFKDSFLATQEPDAPVDSMSALYGSRRLDTYNMALLLPFEMHLNDSIVKTVLAGKELFLLTEIALEYYRGTRLALDSLKKLGLNAEVYVFDIGEDVVDARQVMRRAEMTDMHMIFGPMHKASLAVVSEASRKSGTYLVSPNTFSNEVFADNPYLFRASVSRETMLRYLANYVAIQHQEDNVLMVNSERPKDWPFRKLFKEFYNEAMGVEPNAFADSIRSVTKAQFLGENAAKWLKTDRPNILVVPSNELAFVSDFLTRLSLIDDEEFDIQVYGLDQWVRYDNIEASYKNRFKLRLAVPGHVDYTQPRVVDFVEKFRAKYDMEPSSWGYAFLGFDLAMYFGNALLEHGLSFPIDGAEDDVIGTYSNYRFGRSSTGLDFENKSVYILEYDNYDLKRIN